MVEQWTFNPCVPGSNPGGRTMNNQLNTLNQLHIGDIIGDTKRMVISCKKIADLIHSETFSTWIAICVKEEEFHPYVVWTVVARPQGFVCQSGQYAFTLQEALKYYNSRKS